MQWLSLCAQCVNPSITSASGLGTVELARRSSGSVIGALQSRTFQSIRVNRNYRGAR